MIEPTKLEEYKAEAKARRVKAIVERLTPLTAGQIRALNEIPGEKMKLAQAFGDPEVFIEYLKVEA